MKKFLIALVTLTMFSCGKKMDDEVSNERSSQTPPNIEGLELININAHVGSGSRGLSLTSVTSYTILVDGCASGYSTLSTSANIPIYKGDWNCKGKLVDLTIDSVTYSLSNPNSSQYTTGNVGDKATLTNAAGNSSYIITVASQFSSPVTESDTLAFVFSVVDSSSGGSISQASVGDNHSHTVDGVPAPNTSLMQKSLLGITSSGAGKFTFILECAAQISGNDCDSQDMTTWQWALIKDDYAGNPPLTALQSTVFDTGSGSVQSTIGSNGGVYSPVLTGPVSINTAPKMILIIYNGTSYQTFAVEVELLD